MRTLFAVDVLPRCHAHAARESMQSTAATLRARRRRRTAEARATTSRVHLSILAAFDRARGARRAASRGRPRRPRSFRLKCAQDFSLQHPHHPWAQKQGVRDARRPTRWAAKFPGCINRSPATTRSNAKCFNPPLVRIYSHIHLVKWLNNIYYKIHTPSLKHTLQKYTRHH